MYVPGPDFKAAVKRITDSYNAAVARSADQPVFILGDFNQCDITPLLPNLQQYATCPTHLNRAIDLCYGNIENAYKSVCRPPVSRSDHNVVHLLPKYRQKVKTQEPISRVSQIWTSESVDELRGCFEATDWEVFTSSCDNAEELADTVSCYVTFCEQSVIKTKTVRIYPNNKPWVSKDLKKCLNEKKFAFLQGKTEEYREKEKDFRRQSVAAKLKFKDKVENNFRTGNAKDAWNGLKAMMGKPNQKQNMCTSDDPLKAANDFNRFYSRFDVDDHRDECTSICQSIIPHDLEICEEEVVRVFSSLNANKASGPDGVKSKVLKLCATQLGKIFSSIYQLLMNVHTHTTTLTDSHRFEIKGS